jgi:hypothetical protein
MSFQLAPQYHFVHRLLVGGRVRKGRREMIEDMTFADN